MTISPTHDKLKRNTGKEIFDANDNKLAGEYIYYRKVGDHVTNMPSTLRFGDVDNNSHNYGIKDIIKYAYDNSYINYNSIDDISEEFDSFIVAYVIKG